jgi:hypothetical protein
MKGTLAHSHRRRALAGVLAVASLSGVMLAGCRNTGGGGWWTTTTVYTPPWTPPSTTPTTDCHGHTGDDHANTSSTFRPCNGGTTPTTDCHGHTGDDHATTRSTFQSCGPTTTHDDGHGGHGGGPRTDHPPSAAQQAWARDLVAYTKWALQQIPDVATAERLGYNNIGDNQHWTHAQYRVDGREFDPRRIESLVFNRVTRRVEAAMYNMERRTTAANVPDWAGNWTVWHGHDDLCWRAPEDQPGWTRLGGVKVNGRCTAGSYAHTPVLMVHVWVTDTTFEQRCGALASIDGLGPGSCVPQFQQNAIPARTPPPYSTGPGPTEFPGQARK